MKMKYILQSVVLSATVLVGACIDDQGNYDYQDLSVMFPLEIEGLKDTVFTVLTEAKLEPTVTGLDEKREYEYVWYTYPVKISGSIPKRDTIGREKNLSFLMNYPAEVEYVLIYQVKDKDTGYSVSKRITISGKTEFTTGWFVVKDENEQTDVDFVTTDGHLNSDIVFKATGERLRGKGVKMVYQNGRYYHQESHDDGTVTLHSNLKVFHMVSTQDIWTVSPEDISVYKRYQDMFYIAPASLGPQNMYVAGSDLFLLDNGLFRSIGGMSRNVGKFGYQKLGGEELTEEGLYNVTGGISFMAYSRKSKGFLFLPANGAQFQNFQAPKGDAALQVSTTQMNADLLKLIPRNVPSLGKFPIGWALMKSIEGPQEYYLADIHFSGAKYPFVDFDTISPDRKFWQADVYGPHFLNSFYFAKGNELSYYQKNDSDKNSVEKTNIWPSFGANETISFISQMSSPQRSPKPWNYLVVLTNSPDGWRMYRFTLLGNGVNPEIEKLVEPVYRGKGNARYVMAR